MKILQVINQLEPGGAEILVRDLVIEMQARGADVSIYLLKSTGSGLEVELKSAGVKVYCGAQSSVRSIKQVFFLAKHIRENKYDVIHAHLFPSQLWLPLASRMSGVRSLLICTEHNTYYRRREKFYYRILDSYLFKKYDAVIGVSDNTKLALEKYLPFLKGLVVSVPNGVQLSKFQYAEFYSKEVFFDNQLPIVIAVGRLHPQKNYSILIEAISKIENVNLIVVGEGEERAKLEGQIKAKGLQSRVRLLGNRSDIPRLLKTADMFVMSSLWEGLSIAMLEAMAAEIPLIVTTIPGVVDWVGDAGLFVQPNNADEIAKGIEEILNNSSLKRQLVEAGKLKSNEYSLTKVLERHLEVYSNC